MYNKSVCDCFLKNKSLCVDFNPVDMTSKLYCPTLLLTFSHTSNLVSQEHTKVGSADSQDIQLCGMGIQAEHCVIDIAADSAVVLSPYRNAR